jgi:hypothetical protein
MKTIFPLCFVLLALFLAGTGCKPKSSDPARKDLLVRTWRTGTVSINGTPDNNTVYDSYRWQFGADGKYLFTLAPGQTQSGTWGLTGNDTGLVLDAGTPAERQATIQQLSSTNFDWTLVTKDYKQGDLTLVLRLVPVQ